MWARCGYLKSRHFLLNNRDFLLNSGGVLYANRLDAKKQNENQQEKDKYV